MRVTTATGLAGFVLVVSAVVAVPADAATPHVSKRDARATARAFARLAVGDGGLRVARCVRFGSGRVDCAVREPPGGCAIVVSVRARHGYLLRSAYACHLARRPSRAQSAAAQRANAVATLEAGCELLDCPPGYGPRPNVLRALLLPSTSLLGARPFSARPLRIEEAEGVATRVASELEGLEAPETPHDAVWEVRDCLGVGERQAECELGDRLGGPGCITVHVALRDDGWIAADPEGCRGGRSLVEPMIARRALECRSTSSDCYDAWAGEPAVGPQGAGPVAGFERIRVCWRIVVRGKRIRRCLDVSR